LGGISMEIIWFRQRLWAFVVLLSLAVGLTVVTSGCGGGQLGQPSSASSAKSLLSVAIAPPTGTIALGNNLQFSATALFSDGSKTDVTSTASWTSAQPQVALISASGMATSKGVGATSISAVYKSVSGSSTLTVAQPALVSIAVTPQSPVLTPNHSLQLSATGTFTDGSTQNLSSTVSWSSTQPNVLAISNTGLATGNSPGAASVIAAVGSVTGSDNLAVALPTLVSMALSPQSITLTPMRSTQLQALGTYSDASTKDISGSVTWSASPGGIVAVSTNGLATGKALGAATITAVSNSVSAIDAVMVVAPTLTSISITPSGGSIPLGESQQFSATGTYNDGSTQDLTTSVQWTSSNPTILSLSGAGTATAAAVGTVTVTAMSGTVAATDQLQVAPPIVVSFSVAPANSVLALGAHEQLSAMATFSDGTSQDMTASVSWSSANPAIANVSNQGFLLAEQVGQATISVSSDSVEGSATVTVKPALAVSYFSNAHTSGAADATVRLTNPGVTGGNLCAQIYVFDQDQQLSECCGCLLSPDGLRTLSVNTDLTGNPLTGVKSKTGVIKIVSSDASANQSCDPTATAPDALLAAWSTNIQKQNSSFAITETPFQLGPLGDDELAALQSQCSFSSTLGSGQGLCSCGTIAGGGTQGTQ
jgi:Bacterial Ig-like domain (group 2)